MLWTVDHGLRASLQEQIAADVRRGVRTGVLVPGERLPPAQELADALDVDRNTVLAAYRQLRQDGLLEFRRGRGARIAARAQPHADVDGAARELVEVARRHGYGRTELIKLIEELT
jgi:GntR family transcriptional regulator